MDRIFVNKKIKQLEQLQLFQTDTFYKETLKNIVDINQKKPFKIAVVGEFSTGKSTFINAILGVDLLCHATEEVTATITNIHNVPATDKRYRTCDVTFMNGDIVHLDDDVEIGQYTTTQSKENNVAREIKCVDYYANYMSDDTDILIVDTPGLNGMADGHRELTLEEVKSADFCIYLFGIRGVADSDKVIIRQLEYYQKNFIFVLNFVDQLKMSEGESAGERIVEISDILKKDIFSDQEVNYVVFGISALKALAYKDKGIKKLYQDDQKEISLKEREVFYAESGFEEFENYVHSQVNRSTVEKLSVDRMVYLIRNLLNDVLNEMNEMQERIEQFRQEANTSQGIQKIEERMRYFKEVSEKNKKKVLDYARSECINVRKEFLNYVREQLTAMNAEYCNYLMGFKKYEELESFIKSGKLDARLKVDADKIYDYTEKNIAYCFNGILNNIMVRIQEYLKGIHISKAEKEIEFEIEKISSKNAGEIITMEYGIKKTKEDLSNAQRRYKTAESDMQSTEEKYRKNKESFEKNVRLLDKKEKEQQNKIQELGAQPEVKKRTEYKTKYYTAYEYRGGLGILDALLGPKEVTRSKRVPHTIVDDGARKRWVKERDRIRNETQAEIDCCRARVDADKNRIKNSERQMKKRKGDIALAKEDCEHFRQKLDQDKAMLDNLKKKANRELLDSLRNSVVQQLEAYCSFEDGTIAITVKEYIEEVMKKNSRLIERKTEQFYDERVKKVIESYEQEVEGKKNGNILKYGDYKADIEKIIKIQEELAGA